MNDPTDTRLLFRNTMQITPGHIERLVQPVRDMFAAIFFVSVGMLLDPRLVLEHWKGVVVFTLLVIVGNLIAVSVGAFLAGNGVHTAIRAAMSLAQIVPFASHTAAQTLGALSVALKAGSLSGTVGKT